MHKITTFFIENSKLTFIISIMMALIGVMALKNLTAEVNPAVDFATAIISTPYKGASAKDIEIKITKPIEDEISEISDIKDVKSISQPGLSTIIVRLEMDKRGVDIPKTMADLQRAVDRAEGLPVDLEDQPKFTEIKSEEFPVLTLAITGSNKNRKRDIVADLLKEDLQDYKDIKSISLEGFKERRFQIELDPTKMRKHHIGISEVLGKIESRNIDIPSGNLKSDSDQFLTRIEAKVANIEDLKNLVIRANFNGNLVTLKDIANILDGEKEIDILTRYNAKPATFLTINKKSNTDTITLVNKIEDKIVSYQTKYKDLTFQITLNESKKVNNRLSILASNAILGFIIILSSLFIFLPRQIAISSAISVPLVILSILGFMFFMGINLNTVTIMALVIVLGMLVDDSVVISEYFTKNLQKGYSPKESAILSVKALALPITITVLTTVGAFMPMLVTKGIMGEFIKWIPIIVSLSLMLSLFESFWILPTRLATIKMVVQNPESNWFHKFELKFERLVANLIKKRYLVLLGFFAIIFISLFMMVKANKFILFPYDQVEVYMARIKVDKNSRLENTDKIMANLAQQVQQKLGKDVDHINSWVGVSDLNASRPKYSQGSHVGYMQIYVTDDAKYNLPYQETMERLRSIKTPDNISELSFEALENGPPVGSDIEAKLRSNNLNEVDKIIELIIADLKKIPGIIDLRTDDIVGEDEVFINIDYEKTNKLGLKISSVGNAIRTAIAGSIISQITLDNKDIDLFVRFKENSRESIDNLKNIKILDQFGNLVPISNLASFERKSGSAFIKRFDNKRSKTLLGNVDYEVITPLEANQHLREIFSKYEKDFPEVSLKFGGAEESTKESMDSLGQAFNLSIISIFALLVFLFKSYSRPFIILTTIPLGLFGLSIAFFLHGQPISFMSIVGIVGLGGIIVNSGIILISYVLHLKTDHPERPLHEVLAYASSMRLKSVIITSFTTIAGLAPTAYGIGGSDPILSPMTLALVWGLTSGTILTLLWVPCAYAILDDFSKLKFRKIFCYC